MPSSSDAQNPPTAQDPQGLRALLGAVLPLWSAQLETLQGQIRNGLDALLLDFSGFATLGVELERESGQNLAPERLLALGQSLSTLSDRVLHNLQFGDRVHQLIDAIKADQRRLEAELDSLATLDEAGLQDWLERLRASYTTDEQHLTHRGEAPIEGRSSVDYF